MPLTLNLASRVAALETPTFNTQTGAAYTLVAADAGKIVGMNNAGANTLNIPTNASVAFSVGTQIVVRQVGAGQTTIAAVTPGTTTVSSRGTALKIAGQLGYALLVKTATDTWDVTGDLTA